MGIPVWVRRVQMAPAGPVREESVPDPVVAPEPVVKRTPAVETPTPVVDAAPVVAAQFRLLTVNVDRVLAIGEFAGQDERRFVTDVVRVAAKLSTTTPAWHAFDWPQQAGVSDLEAASRAFAAFLQARLEATGPDHVILFGARPATLLFAEQSSNPPAEHMGARLSCFAEVATLRREPERKRAIWQAISNQPES